MKDNSNDLAIALVTSIVVVAILVMVLYIVEQ